MPNDDDFPKWTQKTPEPTKTKPHDLGRLLTTLENIVMTSIMDTRPIAEPEPVWRNVSKLINLRYIQAMTKDQGSTVYHSQYERDIRMQLKDSLKEAGFDEKQLAAVDQLIVNIDGMIETNTGHAPSKATFIAG